MEYVQFAMASTQVSIAGKMMKRRRRRRREQRKPCARAPHPLDHHEVIMAMALCMYRHSYVCIAMYVCIYVCMLVTNCYQILKRASEGITERDGAGCTADGAFDLHRPRWIKS